MTKRPKTPRSWKKDGILAVLSIVLTTWLATHGVMINLEHGTLGPILN